MLRLAIKTENAAFSDGSREMELARILRRAAERIEDGDRTGTLMDTNGNAVGTFTLTGGR